MDVPSTSDCGYFDDEDFLNAEVLTDRSLIHLLPYETMRDICDILDAGGTWLEIVGSMPDISTMDVEGCKKYERSQLGAGASWYLLRIWASKGYSILDLFKLFAITKMVRCMNILKKHVSVQYHPLIQSCVGGSASGTPKVTTNPNTLNSFRTQQGTMGSARVPPSEPPSSSSVLRPPTTANPSTSSTAVECDGLFSGLQNTPQVSYSELEEATDNFGATNIVGKGGYGVVYRGEWKHTKVAVKRLHSGNDKSNKFEKERLRQSLQELRMLAKYRHDNILPLYAISLDGPEPCLIYQFMENGSLEDRLLCRKGTPPLSWQLKLAIAQGSARGLHFLHSITKTTPIIHGDVKTANILLDKHLEPKLGDFGLSRDGRAEADIDEKCPLIASHIKGTLAYLPPEFITSKILSTKLDVYSFGVVLLELATGLRPYVDTRTPNSLVGYSQVIRDQNNARDSAIYSALGDRRTPASGNGRELEYFSRLFSLGLDCSQKERNSRPSFKQVVDALMFGDD